MIEFVDAHKCKVCGTCVEVCPMDVFRLDSELKKSEARYGEDCQTCFSCELEYLTGAIRISPFRKKRVQSW